MLTWISLKPNALPIVVAVKSLPPLPNVVTAQVLQPYKNNVVKFHYYMSSVQTREERICRWISKGSNLPKEARNNRNCRIINPITMQSLCNRGISCFQNISIRKVISSYETYLEGIILQKRIKIGALRNNKPTVLSLEQTSVNI